MEKTEDLVLEYDEYHNVALKEMNISRGLVYNKEYEMKNMDKNEYMLGS